MDLQDLHQIIDSTVTECKLWPCLSVCLDLDGAYDLAWMVRGSDRRKLDLGQQVKLITL